MKKTKTTTLYVPNTPDMFHDHVRVRCIKASVARVDRLFDLYAFFANEQHEVRFPAARARIEESLPYYKERKPAVLEADIKLLIELSVLQETSGKLRLDFMDMISARGCEE